MECNLSPVEHGALRLTCRQHPRHLHSEKKKKTASVRSGGDLVKIMRNPVGSRIHNVRTLSCNHRNQSAADY